MSKKNKSRWPAPNQQNRALASDNWHASAPKQAEVFPPASDASISPAQLAANRLNSQLSTGPVTETGKQIVSRNAVRHGLTGKFNVAPDESQENFDALLAGLMEAEQAADQEEVQYVQYMAESTWLSRRAMRLQDEAILAMQCGTREEKKQAAKDLALYLRYMSTHDRAYSRYATELRKHRNDRMRADRGFVSQKYKEAAETRRNEVHQLRQERVELNNRIAAARAERLERQNITSRPPKMMPAAA